MSVFGGHGLRTQINQVLNTGEQVAPATECPVYDLIIDWSWHSTFGFAANVMLASMWSAWRFKSPFYSVVSMYPTNIRWWLRDRVNIMVGDRRYAFLTTWDALCVLTCLDIQHLPVYWVCAKLLRVLRNAIGGSWLPPDVRWSTRVALRVF